MSETPHGVSRMPTAINMICSKRSAADLLNETAEERSVREKLRTIQKEQKSQQQRKPKRNDWER